MHTEIYEKLEKVLEGRVVILGIGNPIRGDDAFGSFFADRILGKINFIVYNGGSSPENILGKIIQDNPDTILFVDAIDFGGSYGEMSLFNADEIKTRNFFFTHNPSPYLVVDFLRENTRAKIYLLAVQPKSITLGDKISPEIEKSLNCLAEWFLQKYAIKR